MGLKIYCYDPSRSNVFPTYGNEKAGDHYLADKVITGGDLFY